MKNPSKIHGTFFCLFETRSCVFVKRTHTNLRSNTETTTHCKIMFYANFVLSFFALTTFFLCRSPVFLKNCPFKSFSSLHFMHSIKYFSICCWPKSFHRRCLPAAFSMIASPIWLKLKTILKLSTRKCVCVCVVLFLHNVGRLRIQSKAKGSEKGSISSHRNKKKKKIMFNVQIMP